MKTYLSTLFSNLSNDLHIIDAQDVALDMCAAHLIESPYVKRMLYITTLKDSYVIQSLYSDTDDIKTIAKPHSLLDSLFNKPFPFCKTEPNINNQKPLKLFKKNDIYIGCGNHKTIHGLLVITPSQSESSEDFFVLSQLLTTVLDRIYLKDELIALNQSLETHVIQEVEKREAALKAAQEMAQLASFSIFSKGIAHEIRNPVMAMLSSTLFTKIEVEEDPYFSAPLITQETLCEELDISKNIAEKLRNFLKEKELILSDNTLEMTYNWDSPIIKKEFPNWISDPMIKGLQTIYKKYLLKETLTIIKSHCERLLRMTQLLLKFGSTEVIPKSEHTELQPILDDSTLLIKGIAQQHNIKFETHYTQQNLSIYANADQIIQICLNLMTNSIQSMKYSSTKCLSISTKEESYMTQSHHLVPGVKISISDTGQGISKDDQLKIFMPFFTTKSNGQDQNIGLGLSIVKQIVLDHNGLITVTSSNKGTCFDLFLPQQKPKQPASL